MDRDIIDYIGFCNEKREEAIAEYAKYNGYTSQKHVTREEERLGYMQMGVMAEFTKKNAQFWQEKYEQAIGLQRE